jgi:uncharacterized protein with PIN domain
LARQLLAGSNKLLRGFDMAHESEKKAHVCELCGGEADLIIREEKVEDSTKGSQKKGTLVCKVCGSEADTIFEEI